MEKIIYIIKEEMKKQRLSEQKLADKAGLTQNKVHRIIAGKTQKLDLQAINSLFSALGITPPGSDIGMVSESETPYPDFENMSLEGKIRFLGLNPRDTRFMIEAMKMSEEERDELLKKMANENLEKGRF